LPFCFLTRARESFQSGKHARAIKKTRKTQVLTKTLKGLLAATRRQLDRLETGVTELNGEADDLALAEIAVRLDKTRAALGKLADKLPAADQGKT
jgi:hypothetical protein